MSKYVSLHNFTVYSVGRGMMRPKELISRAKELGQKAVAVTDNDTMAGIWEAYKEAKKQGVKLIPGCVFNFSEVINDEYRLYKIVLLAKNKKGYLNLLSLRKVGFDNISKTFKSPMSRISWKELEKFSEGIICLSGDGNGLIPQMLMNNSRDVDRVAKRFSSIFGDNFYLELQPHNLQVLPSSHSGKIDQRKINSDLKKLSERLNLKCVVATNAYYLNESDHDTHDVLMAINAKQPVYSGQRFKLDKKSFFVKSEDEVRGHFNRHKKFWGEDFIESLIENTSLIADSCENPDYIDPAVSTGNKSQLPIFPVKDQGDYEDFKEWIKTYEKSGDLEEDALYYRYRSFKGLNEKINSGVIPKEDYDYCVKQMEEEFDVLEFRGFSSYMLIVADFLEWSRNNGVTIGPGRGCVTEDTLIYTESGFKPIVNTVIGERVYSHTGRLDTISLRMSYPLEEGEELVSIRTDSDFVSPNRFTSNHKQPLYVDGEIFWVPSANIAAGDEIFMPIPKTSPIIYNVNPDEYYFFGVALSSASLIKNDNGEVDKLSLFLNDKNYKIVNDYLLFSGVKTNKVNEFRIDVLYDENKSFIDELDYKTSGLSRVPSDFRKCSRTTGIFNSFIEGITSSYPDDGEIKIPVLDKNLALDIKELLLLYGVKSSVVFYKGGYDQKYFSDCWEISFVKHPINGFCGGGVRINSGERGILSKVISVDFIRANKGDKVYDRRVAVDHSYMTASHATHNSVGGSITAYLTGIHEAYPKKYGLVFARFLNKFKDAFPDIDSDFAPAGRDRVHNYLKEKYGEEYFAGVSNLNKITPKVYAKDVSRALEFGGDRKSAVAIGNDIANSIPDEVSSGVDSALNESPLFGEYCKVYPDLIKYKNLCNKIRAWSSHAGGIVIGRTPLHEIAAIRKDRHGETMLEYDKEDIEEQGLVKIDTLGLTTLDIIDDTYRLIRENGKTIDDKFDYEMYDEKAYDLISNGSTFKVFQMGGTAEHACKLFKPKSVPDIALVSAAIRPSTKDKMMDILKVRNGEMPLELPHESLTRSYAHTYGYGLYEESLLTIAEDVAGWDLHDADKLRQMVKSKGKYPERDAKLREDFIQSSMGHLGIDRELAESIWEDYIYSFSGYGFNLTLSDTVKIGVYSKRGEFIGDLDVKDVKPGQYVKLREEDSGQNIFAEVAENHYHGEQEVYEVELENGLTVECTMHHKFRVKETGQKMRLHDIIESDLSIVCDESLVNR